MLLSQPYIMQRGPTAAPAGLSGTHASTTPSPEKKKIVQVYKGDAVVPGRPYTGPGEGSVSGGAASSHTGGKYGQGIPQNMEHIISLLTGRRQFHRRKYRRL